MLAWSREKKPVQPMVKHPLKVLDWGAINFKGKVGIHIFTENLDRHLYRKILNEQLYNNADALQKKKGFKNKFIGIIREEWEGIEKNFIVNSIGSMQNRVQACIDAEGAHTK
ncbi:2870_t:CDS:2 [Entrophospora sp. SA101]|nr:2870_t:CDS:2 [Entrophospora sp. SA101]